MRFLVETFDDILSNIKQDLIATNHDLQSLNGGQCIEVTTFIEEHYGYPAYNCYIFRKYKDEKE